MRFSIGSCRTLIVVGILISAGCGGGDGTKPLANLVPVSGTVSLEGKPLAQGTVAFIPEGPGQSASGKISNGSFTMATTVSAPGVVAGKYKVQIDSKEQPAAGAAAAPPPSGAVAPPKSLIPAKYSDVKTSGLEVDVVKGMPAIKWDLKP